VSRQIRFNAFDMNCVAHQSPGLWRYPGDQSWRYKDIEYWQNIAQIAERGLFDAVFIADVLGTYDVFGGNDLAAIRQGAQVPVNDPLQLAVIGAGRHGERGVRDHRRHRVRASRCPSHVASPPSTTSRRDGWGGTW
jgi:alkanesulfonate monooxygenase SsuD/methylene tetrahydromethanopterin reductase-like flavin-dependent oxidoreductase (luciferase family)